MNEHDELNGTVVLVRPDLLNDPAGRKNQVGIISFANVPDDNVVVSFSDGTGDLFSFDALLVLRNTDDIRRDADIDFSLLPREDYYDITEACMLAECYGPVGRRVAVELAQKSPMVLEYALRPLNDELGLERHKGPTR